MGPQRGGVGGLAEHLLWCRDYVPRCLLSIVAVDMLDLAEGRLGQGRVLGF